jgi:hypothetical protein
LSRVRSTFSNIFSSVACIITTHSPSSVSQMLVRLLMPWGGVFLGGSSLEGGFVWGGGVWRVVDALGLGGEVMHGGWQQLGRVVDDWDRG